MATVPIERSGRLLGLHVQDAGQAIPRPSGRGADQTEGSGPTAAEQLRMSIRTKLQFSIRTVLYESALDQSSTTNRGTRPNSFVFDVTSIKLRDSACPAIRVS